MFPASNGLGREDFAFAWLRGSPCHSWASSAHVYSKICYTCPQVKFALGISGSTAKDQNSGKSWGMCSKSCGQSLCSLWVCTLPSSMVPKACWRHLSPSLLDTVRQYMKHCCQFWPTHRAGICCCATQQRNRNNIIAWQCCPAQSDCCSVTGIPWSDVNLGTHAVASPKWNPASSTSEVTTLAMEYGYLARLTGGYSPSSHLNSAMHKMRKYHSSISKAKDKVLRNVRVLQGRPEAGIMWCGHRILASSLLTP